MPIMDKVKRAAAAGAGGAAAGSSTASGAAAGSTARSVSSAGASSSSGKPCNAAGPAGGGSGIGSSPSNGKQKEVVGNGGTSGGSACRQGVGSWAAMAAALPAAIGATDDDDDDLKRAIAESMRMAHELQEAALTTPGARVEAGMVVVPNVGDAAPLSILEAEYAAGDHGALWAAKLRSLSARYMAIRRVRGDGNCFYRSLWMGYMERLLALPVAERRRFWEEDVPGLVSTLRVHLPDDERRREFVTLGETFARSACALCNVPDSAPDSAAGAAGAAVAALLAAARRSDESREALRWLRLLTSARMRSEKEVYAPLAISYISYGAGVGAGAAGGGNEGGTDLDTFCTREVETMGVEADEPQIQALATALNVVVRVEYLVPRGPHRHVVCGLRAARAALAPAAAAAAEGSAAEGAAEETPRPTPGMAADASESLVGCRLAACVLYRPGHYDVLTPRNWDDPALLDGTDQGRAEPLTDQLASQPEVPPPPSVEASPGAAASTGAAASRVAGASRAQHEEERAQQLELLLSFAPDASDEARARALDAARAAQRLPSYNGLDSMPVHVSLIEHAAALLFDPKEVDRLLRIARGPIPSSRA